MLKCQECEALLPISYESCPKCGNSELEQHVSIAFKREKVREESKVVEDNAFVVDSKTKLD
jgi:predicted nucleic-acid-binding Zn-ribbon protein